MIKKNVKHTRGFTLLEVIFALFLISVVLAPVISVISYTIGAAQISANRLIAANLAQEGVEIVRNIRDAQNDWGDWYAALANSTYSVQYDKSDLINDDANKFLRKDANGFYNYDSGDILFFKRKISLQKISSDEVKVLSGVYWKQRGREYQTEVEDRLYNWR